MDRPALAAAMPTAKGTPVVLLDVGANVDSKPEQIEQFAVMGEIYYRAIFGTKRPRVGLLSIGEEEMKGNELTREASNLIKQTSLNFIGNVEGRDVYAGVVDVIVCDGFIGNIALKISEGLVEHVGRDVEEGDQEPAQFAAWDTCWRKAPSTISGRRRTMPSTAGRRCSVCAGLR